MPHRDDRCLNRDPKVTQPNQPNGAWPRLRCSTGNRRCSFWLGWASASGPPIFYTFSIVTTRADKADAAPTYKRTYGHHPLLAMAGDQGEVVAGMLRPGNAGSNTAEDHLVVLGHAIDALPAQWRAGHQAGDHPDDAAKELVVRADAGGTTHWLTEECRERNIAFSLGYPIDGRVREAVCLTPDEHWQPAVEPNGTARPGAEVVELTDLVDLGAWPEGTRLIVRRERPHPGAQLTLFDTIEGCRHTAFITDQTNDDIAALALFQRQRARAENVIRDTKACGLANLPFDDVVNNDVWMQLAFTAHDLLVWAQAISLTGALHGPHPRRSVTDSSTSPAAPPPPPNDSTSTASWPWTATLLEALNRLRAAFTSLTVTASPAPQPAL